MAKKQVRSTGDFGMGQMVHVVHMSDDVAKLRDWWTDVFGGHAYLGIDEPNYLPIEDRHAALLMISDLCIEVMAPKMPADPAKPVGKFYTKFGQHLHSVGYWVDDLQGLGDRMIAGGVRIGKPGGGLIEKMDPEVMYFFPNPKDTGGLMVEMTKHPMPDDPRDRDDWSSLARKWPDHPLTIQRFSYVTLGVRDLDAAVNTYVETMQAIPIEEGTDTDMGSRYVTMQLGDCLLQIAEPLTAESDLGQHVERYGNFIYSLRFKVGDIDSAERWLTAKGVGTTRPRSGLLALDPADTYGAPIFLSSEEIEGDPFAGEPVPGLNYA